jgi:hypothetical protein
MELSHRSICVKIAVWVRALAGWLPVEVQNCVAVNDAAITEPLQKDGIDVMCNHIIPFADVLTEDRTSVAQDLATPVAGYNTIVFKFLPSLIYNS